MRAIHLLTHSNQHTHGYIRKHSESSGNLSFVETFCINLTVCLLFNVDYIVHLLSYAGKVSGLFDRERSQ